MPIAKELEHYGQQFHTIEEALKDLKKRGDYTVEDVKHWQNKLSHLDEKYREGCFVPESTKLKNPRAPNDPYELEGQAELEEHLKICHDLAHELLIKLE
jgi:hypothetical protein